MTTLQKYTWLIGKLHICGRKMTADELNSACKDKFGETLNRQKLWKWREDIEAIFEIKIRWKKEGGKYYYFITLVDDKK